MNQRGRGSVFCVFTIAVVFAAACSSGGTDGSGGDSTSVNKEENVVVAPRRDRCTIYCTALCNHDLDCNQSTGDTLANCVAGAMQLCCTGAQCDAVVTYDPALLQTCVDDFAAAACDITAAPDSCHTLDD